MIIDVTGVVLTPGYDGRDCLGNGLHDEIECCCDECNYFLCCIDDWSEENCKECSAKECPRNKNK